MASKLPVRPLEAFRRPTAGTPPTQPAGRVLPPGVTARRLPELSFWEGAAVGEIPLLLAAWVAGYRSPYELGAAAAVGYPLGGLAAKALRDRSIVTAAPLSAAGKFATRVLPPTMAQEARRELLPSQVGP